MDATLFCEALTFCDCELGGSDDVFELLERHLRAGGYVADTWLDAIRERECAYPTGLACQELGVAIPHADPCHMFVQKHLLRLSPWRAWAIRLARG